MAQYMCGIAGKVYFRHGAVDKQSLVLMTNKLAHRGPDAKGYYISKNKKVGFGHTRLSIIDLSKAANQPLSYLDKYHIVFNGEIYNFQEKRADLEKDGYKFVTNSDTEVLLALYVKYKEKCVDHLRGMFAFAIYDEQNETVFLARDRIGKKPLKYFLSDNTFIFASELKAILTQKEVKKEIDYRSIQLYLTYGYVPAPLTGFVGISKLEPGSSITIHLKKKTFSINRYWQPYFKDKLNLSEKDWCTRIVDTLEESVKLRMISDVPLGAFLSGGVDSSGVVAMMSSLSQKPIKTFTVVFKDKKFNESNYAKKISKIYKTDHHELLAEPESTDILPMLAYQYEEPFADASSVVTYLISKMAREHIKVVLNGDGADEQFAGYPNRYLRLQRDVDFDYWIQNIRPFAAETLRLFSDITHNKKIVKAKKFFDKAKLPIYKRFASYNQIFGIDELEKHSIGELKKIYEKQNPYDIVDECFSKYKGKGLKDAGLKFDLLYYLPDDLLAKVDIASMAVSLEARSPFLDHNMIELSCKMPFDLKVKNGETKYIEKKALEKIVPKENLYRPKMGFSIPLGVWFSGKLNDYAYTVLLSPASKIKDIINPEYIKSMIKSNNKNEDFGLRLWSLMSLELWMQQYFS